MDNGKNRWVLVIAAAAVVALVFGCCAGTMGGAAVAYVVAQRVARQVPAARLQRLTPAPAVPAPLATPRARQTVPGNRATPGGQQTPQIVPPQTTSGVIVQEVVAGSPAEKAGLRPGDIITQLDDVRLDANHKLSDLVAARKAGDQVKLSILREGQNQVITATLGQRADSSGTAYLGVRYLDATAGPTPTP
jgi:S1-C subfamily serine protease